LHLPRAWSLQKKLLWFALRRGGQCAEAALCRLCWVVDATGYRALQVPYRSWKSRKSSIRDTEPYWLLV
jgi:hypothetical protein